MHPTIISVAVPSVCNIVKLHELCILLPTGGTKFQLSVGKQNFRTKGQDVSRLALGVYGETLNESVGIYKMDNRS